VIPIFLSPFGVPALASWAVLFPPESWAFPHGRLTGPDIGSDSDGVSTFRIRNMRPGWVPSMPWGRRCSRGRSGAPGRRLPLPSGQPYTPVEHPGSGAHFDEASSRVRSHSPVRSSPHL
jgi:hypothetical protein